MLASTPAPYNSRMHELHQADDEDIFHCGIQRGHQAGSSSAAERAICMQTFAQQEVMVWWSALYALSSMRLDLSYGINNDPQRNRKQE